MGWNILLIFEISGHSHGPLWVHFLLTLVKFYSVWTLNFLFPWNVISDQLVCLHFERLQQQQKRGAWFIFVAGKSLPCLSQALEVKKTCCSGPDLNPSFLWAFTWMPSASESTGLKGLQTSGSHSSKSLGKLVSIESVGKSHINGSWSTLLNHIQLWGALI